VLHEKAVEAVEKAIETAKEGAAEKVATVATLEKKKIEVVKAAAAKTAEEAGETASDIKGIDEKAATESKEESLAANVVKAKSELTAAKADDVVNGEIQSRDAKGADFAAASAKETAPDPVQDAKDKKVAEATAVAKVEKSKHIWPVPQVRLHEEKLEAQIDRHKIGLNRVKTQLSKVDEFIKKAGKAGYAFGKHHHKMVLAGHEQAAIDKENIAWDKSRKESENRLIKQKEREAAMGAAQTGDSEFKKKASDVQFEKDEKAKESAEEKKIEKEENAKADKEDEKASEDAPSEVTELMD